MTVEITKEDQEKLSRLVSTGRFHDLKSAVHEAINSLDEKLSSSVCHAPVWPVGFLRDVYRAEDSAEELRFLDGNSLRVEDF